MQDEKLSEKMSVQSTRTFYTEYQLGSILFCVKNDKPSNI